MDDCIAFLFAHFCVHTELSATFGAHIPTECTQLLSTYDPRKEFIFLRLYLSTGASGDASLFFDPVEYAEEDAEFAAKAMSKVNAVAAPPQFTMQQLLLDGLKLIAGDRAKVEAGSFVPAELLSFLARQHCASCDKESAAPEKSNMACSGCLVATYCGRDCQVAHWKSTHKQMCKQMAAARAKLQGGGAK